MELKEAIKQFKKETTQDNMLVVLDCLKHHLDTYYLVPVELPDHMIDDSVNQGDIIKTKDQTSLKIKTFVYQDMQAYPLFLDKESAYQQMKSSFLEVSLRNILEACMKYTNGVVIDPYQDSLYLPLSLIEMIIKPKVPNSRIFFNVGAIEDLEVQSRVFIIDQSDRLNEGEAMMNNQDIQILLSDKEEFLIGDSYINALEIAKHNNIHSLAIPFLNTFNLHQAMALCLITISKWLNENKDYSLAVIINLDNENLYHEFQKFLKKGVSHG